LARRQGAYALVAATGAILKRGHDLQNVLRAIDRPVRLGRPRRVPHLADAASGPAFCAVAGVLHRAAFGPREAVSARAVSGARVRREALDPRANPVVKAAAWLRENL
ncbi:MAG TPA: DUF2794 domain-containing protein, partial [Phenylobacterium sp.]|nr:DUF2794 domain-containing protein [Phenylobacterium sp.]